MTAEVIDIVATATPGRRLYRTEHAVVAGVAAGLADHLRGDVRLVRGAFVVLLFAGGVGAMMYLALWAVVPQAAGASPRHESPERRPIPPMDRNLLLPLAALLVGGLLFAGQLGLGIGGGVVWPLVLGGIGVTLVWREADDAQRARLAGLSSRTAQFAAVREPYGLVRIAGGVLLLFAGIGAFVGTHADWSAVLSGLRAAVIVLAGVLLIFGPWWWRLVNELTAERRERIRSQERVEVATHVHDSVLHTLALIQRSASDPREVARLARGQERELRRWLYRPEGGTGADSLHAALEAVAAEVEDTHAVTVDLIVVGDCSLDEAQAPVVAAAREALVNAAKHAGVEHISLYAEVEGQSVSVFVRDRGRGFTPDAVPAGRYGVAESVIGRMRRAGGTATVRSAPGTGTEVELHMTRAGR
jgi:signal transduction histidine kinase/phage shock protein PspC (stress-responsive transcriptional regulator)